ncbi:MAG: CapA family protein [candidate division WOR-3 bacterium]
MKRMLFYLFIWSNIFADTLSIIMVGDIMMGTTYPEKRLPPSDGKYIFKNVIDILKNADLTLGNLEGPLTESRSCSKKIEKGKVYAFRTPTRYAYYLKDAGFDFVNLNNNHIYDFGEEGLESTINILKSLDIQYGTCDEYGKFNIKNISICILSFSFGRCENSILDIERATKIVAEKKREYGIVIVSFHGGGEGIDYLHLKDTMEYYLGEKRGNLIKFSHAVIDSGADLVWGHGPHVPRAIEVYKNRLIAYSLGNFFTYGFNIEGVSGYAPILKVYMDFEGNFLGGEIISAIQRSDGVLELDTLNQSANLIKSLSFEDFPLTSPLITSDGKIIIRNSR